MRTIAVGDIHGCYNELKSLIDGLMDEGYYNPDTDRIVFLGDYVDRGDNSREVIKYIREMQEKYGDDNVVALMGNHEDMLLSFYDRRDYSWLYNGYNYTAKSYAGKKDEFYSDMEWMRTLPLYFEDDNFIYVHAGIDSSIEGMENQNRYILLWVREKFILNSQYYGKTIIFGHTPTELLDGSKNPYVTKIGNIDIDTGCVFGGALTSVIIDDDSVLGYYQVESENKNMTTHEEEIA